MIKKGLAVAVILLFIGMSVVPSTAVKELENVSNVSFNGNTLYVGGSGPNNYTSIQLAVIDAEDGDTVFVFDDSSPYRSGAAIYKAITLMGEDKNTTIIENTKRGQDGIAIYSDNVTVTGFTVNGFKYGIAAGIHVYTKDNTSISNNIITNNSWGIRLQKSYYCSIFKNEIFANDCDGLYQEHGGGFCDIFENNIYENGYVGIAFGGYYNNYSYNVVKYNDRGGIGCSGDRCVLFKNDINYNYGEGIELVLAYQNVIKQNIINGNEEGLKFCEESLDNLILENTISNNSRFGIDFENPYDIELENNTFLDNIFIKNNGNIMDKNNNLIGNSFIDDGIYIESDCIVQNNTVNGKKLVYMVGESDKIVEDAGEIIIANCNNITIADQILTNTYHGIVLYESNNCLITNNTIKYNRGSGIVIDYSNNNQISRNCINDNREVGIDLFSSINNHISRNSINNHNDDNNLLLPSTGIQFGADSNNNIVSENNITFNNRGVDILGSNFNKIISNNFLNNMRSATFSLSFLNRWDRNFWDKPRMLPKPIFGTFILFFPLVNFDLRPAQEPYDIGV